MTRGKCFKCRKELPVDGEGIICKGGCQQKYHILCAGLTESTYRGMPMDRRNKWKCVDCRPTRRKDRKGSKNVAGEESEQEYSDDSSQPIKQLEGSSQKNQEQSIDVELNNEDTSVLIQLNKNILELQKDMKEVKVSVQFISDKYDKIIEEIKGLKDLKANQIKVEDKLVKLEDRVNELEQYSRCRNLEIRGVEECANENLKQVIVKIASKVGEMGIVESDIDVVHRIGNMNNRTPKDIIVQFKDRESRNKLLLRKKERLMSKEVTEGRNDNVVYINEHLTSFNKQLLWQAKIRSRERNFKFVWSKEGKIFVRKHEKEKALRIKTEEDLRKIE